MKKEFEKEQNDNQIDDAFLDMPDMEDDEKFRQWLEEEYLKEADAIEEALFDGRKFEDNQDIVEKLSVSRESFYQQLLRQIPFPTKTAAFFLSDYFAIEAISYLGSKGIRVPADLGIAGFDDINYAHLTVPKLTTIHQNMERKAELAVTELLSAIQNPIYMGKEVLLDVMLIARDSI